MDDSSLIFELNKILTLEHGHLGMYENYLSHKDKDTRRTFRRFMEIESDHIDKIKGIILNLGGKPSMVVEGGDIIGKLFGIAINTADELNSLKTYSFIEKKSYEGYNDFVNKMENDTEKRNQMIGEMASSNMIEAELMYIWLEEKIKKIKHINKS